ncbi:MAG: Fic family protein [Dysgonamonadaceae bacterium]|jgi:Fic family protein|nr:Fic family protein [Dysgonamonadaceae bacterium]
MNKLITYLTDEKNAKRKGGLYHKTQVNLAYNSNRIEGGKLTEEQTRYIFETRTIGFKDEDAVPVDDIIETSNHFVAFDYLLDTVNETLSVELIKKFHGILKNGTADSQKSWFAVGDWKKLANEVSGMQTTKPENVADDMEKLLDWHNSSNRHCGLDPQSTATFENIIEFHWRFEGIHPFQDGNGRVGRLILFRECLKHNHIPFIIDERHKQYYYRGLREFAHIRGYLMDTCLPAQDTYKEYVRYFYPDILENK